MSKTSQEILASNQERIQALSTQIKLRSSVTKSKEKARKVREIQERLQFHLMSLEIRGQREKIKSMEEVLATLKDATVTTDNRKDK